MGVWITLRQNNEKSYFRDNLLGMISRTQDLDGNRLILASGYFSEYEKQEYSICGDNLKKALETNPKICEIDIIGAKGSIKSFNRFCEKIRNLGRERFIPIRLPKNNWHAKIAMILKPVKEGSRNDRKRGTIPVCAIVGSSNLTRPAFGIDPRPQNVHSDVKFNYECDVLIFSNDYFSNSLNNEYLTKIFPDIGERREGSIYFPEIDNTFSLSESTQLMALFNLIKNSSKECKEKL